MTQQWLSSAEHFFGLSKTNVKYSIIICVMHYALFSRLRNHDWRWKGSPRAAVAFYCSGLKSLYGSQRGNMDIENYIKNQGKVWDLPQDILDEIFFQKLGKSEVHIFQKRSPSLKHFVSHLPCTALSPSRVFM